MHARWMALLAVLIAGPIKVPMKPVTPPPPVGLPNAKTPVTEPHFAALVVLPERDQKPNH